MAVGTHLLVDEALASTARPELDNVTVLFHEGHEPQHVVQLLTLRVRRVRGFIAYGAQQQIQPLVPSETLAPADEIVDIAAGELDRADMLDPEGAILAYEDEGVVIAQGDLGPDAPHQQAIMAAHLTLLDVDVVEAEVGQARPVLVMGLDELHRDFIDDLIAGVLL